MKDINIIIEYADGSKMAVPISAVEEDVIRHRLGLGDKEEQCKH